MLKQDTYFQASMAVVHNVRPAGHIRPATSPHVARDAQQEKRLLQSLH